MDARNAREQREHPHTRHLGSDHLLLGPDRQADRAGQEHRVRPALHQLLCKRGVLRALRDQQEGKPVDQGWRVHHQYLRKKRLDLEH